METTALLNPNNQIFDPIRKRWVAARPEETIRQAVIQLLLQRGVPAHAILVEADLARLPCGGLKTCRSRRRVDLMVARFESGEFRPKLLVECKAGRATDRALDQLLSYQASCNSRWLCLAAADGLWVFDTQQTSGQGWSRELPELTSGV
jgi:hypothetical protein